MTDPYETLGVDRGADDKAVRSAYRRKVKKAHPDAGGTREEFDAVSRSLALLTNPKRREHYDKTGEWQADNPENPLSGPMSVIMAFFNEVVGQHIGGNGQDPLQYDLIAAAKGHIRAKLATLKTTKAMGERHAAKVERIAAKLSKKGGPDHIKSALAWQARQIREQIKPVDADIESHTKAIEMLGEYSFAPDIQMPTFYAFGTGTS